MNKDDELLRRGDVKAKFGFYNINALAGGFVEQLVDSIPAAPREMSAREMAEIGKRFCEARGYVCIDTKTGNRCPLYLEGHCVRLKEHQPLEDFLAKWAAEHPEKKRKTYAEDFAEKFPKAWGNSEGVPYVCRDSVYEGHMCKQSVKDCSACWQEEMEDADE